MVGGGVLGLAVTVAFLRNARESSSDSFNFDVSNLPGTDKLPEKSVINPDQEKLEEDRAEILWKLANFSEEVAGSEASSANVMILNY